jgi:hypothetical protein
VRSWILLFLGVAAVSRLLAEDGWRDPEFDKVPFTQWVAGGPQTQLKWTEHVLPVILSVHQRLLARLQVQLDGAEAAKRRGEGQMIFFFQLTDAMGRIYQDHTTYDLAKVEEGLKAQDLLCTESVFVVPGDYVVSVAIYDTATKEHAIKKDKLHVALLKTDPLPDAWRSVPPVEFEETSEPPDHWFLPKERGKLHLPLATRRTVRIEVLANLTPSEVSGRGYSAQSVNFSILFPTLKVISEMNGPNVSMHVSLLDLSRRRVVFHEEDGHELNWEKMKSSLPDATSASIDVKSLSDRQHNAAFLIKEVAKKSAPVESAPVRAVIVLSGPMVFDAEQDLQGIDLKSSPDSRVFYIRLQNPPAPRQMVSETRRRRGFGGYPGRSTMPGDDIQTPTGVGLDQLEPMLKAFDPRLFDTASAEQIRKALAAIMSEISTM